MKKELINSTIYQVYVRNFTKEGTFNALSEKLDYIKNLGIDILYLLPISPIGEVGRKGDLGSPYSINDYSKINPELGTLEDFKTLIKATHDYQMKLMIDIVFNHTSRDSFILKHHPSWMYHNKEGNFANKVGDWTDVYDLDTGNPKTISYLIKILEYYISLGVDGFRFDVASYINKDFFIKLNKVMSKKYPNIILLAESAFPNYATYFRSLGFNALSDSELTIYGFDMLYQYSSITEMYKYLETKEIRHLDLYKEALKLENILLPNKALRIRGLENHDQKRIYEYTHDFTVMKNLAAYQVFMKGPMFIYNGLETKADHLENLFSKDTMNLDIDESWFNFIKLLIKFKKEKFNQKLLTSNLLDTTNETLAFKNNYEDGSIAFGIFSLTGKEETITYKDLIDGTYIDYLTNKEFIITNNSISTSEPLFLFKK